MPELGRRVPAWAVAGVLVGLALLQAAWIAALPPFRGADEVDHVFRASAVASGDWSSPAAAATRGTGARVAASPEMVEAAGEACLRLAYKEPDDCRLVDRSGGPVVASAAGRYLPTYYVVVGYATRLVDGAAGATLMRAWSALLCLALLAAGLVGLRRWADRRVFAAAVLGVTPTVVYSTTVVAPNGLELIAGLVLWTSLAGLAAVPPARARYHLATLTLSLSALMLLRSLGPLWAATIVAASVLAWPGLAGRLARLVRTASGRAAGGVVAVAAVVGVGWTLAEHSLVMSQDGPGGSLPLGFRVGRALREVPLWLLQDVAAFPFRNQHAPLLVYPLALLVVAALAVVGLRSAARRLRWSVAVILAVGLGLPYVVTVATMSEIGTAWQGRYALPLLIGVPLLLGAGWARSRDGGLRRLAALVVLSALAVVHAAGVYAVAAEMSTARDWTVSGDVVGHPPVWVVGVLAAAGSVVLAGSTVLSVAGRPADAD
ncbi:hypothetical protein GCM10009623_03870 [Nocardioides aestuarii]